MLHVYMIYGFIVYNIADLVPDIILNNAYLSFAIVNIRYIAPNMPLSLKTYDYVVLTYLNQLDPQPIANLPNL